MGYWKTNDDERMDMLERRSEIGAALTAGQRHRQAGRDAAGEAEYEMARVMARAYLQLGGQLPAEWTREIMDYAERATREREMIDYHMSRGLSYLEACEALADEYETEVAS